MTNCNCPPTTEQQQPQNGVGQCLSSSTNARCCGSSSSPIVHTSYGTVIGTRQRLTSGAHVDLFLGIPFARPPIGELRFEKPMPHVPWTSCPLRACTFGPAAIPLSPTPSAAVGAVATTAAIPCCSEDCLQLNIFRPSGQPILSTSLLPVMVYIHGGGFADGSARQYGYEGWADNFAPEGILVVTVQYRLGPFGFLSFGRGTVLPGNLGLWDICQALRFVHDEIRAFGGDPDRITVVGLSAGGAAAAFMALSPHTKDWVNGSIEMSGTALAEWSASDRTEEASREFVRRALLINNTSDRRNGGREAEKEHKEEEEEGRGKTDAGDWPLSQEHMEQAKRTLKTLTADQIVAIAKAMGTTRADPNLLVWGPCIDGDFLPDDVPALVQQGGRTDKPVLMGLTAEEAIYFTIQAKDAFINPFGIGRECLGRFGTAEFRSFVHNVVLGGKFRRHFERKNSEHKVEQLVQRAETLISAFYLYGIGLDGQCISGGNQELGNNNTQSKQLEQYTRLVSDLLFNVPLFRMAQLRRRCGVPTFLYFNEHFNSSQFEPWTPFRGATHGNEYPYLNGLFPVGEFQFTDADNKHRAILVQMLSTFIRNGAPSLTQGDDNNHHFVWASSNEWSQGEGVAKPLKFARIGGGDGRDAGRHDGSEAVTKVTIAAVEAVEQSGTFWSEFGREFGFDIIRGIAYKGDG